MVAGRTGEENHDAGEHKPLYGVVGNRNMRTLPMGQLTQASPDGRQKEKTMGKINVAGVYYDADTNPSDPGWVLNYEDSGQENTHPLHAKTRAEAEEEAISYLGISREVWEYLSS